MLPINKTIAVLHPYVDTTWWAVKMMIYVAHVLSEKNEVTFFTFYYNKTKKFEYLENFIIKDYYKSRIGKIISMFLMAFAIRKCKYVIVWNSPMHFVWVLSKLLFFSKAKIIWWNHHYPWYYSQNTTLWIFLKRLLEKLIIKKIDLILANSCFLQKSIKEIYNKESQILYPPLDEWFENHKIEQKQNNFTLFTYSRWVKWKNIWLVFQLYDELKIIFPELKIIIWGEGEELDIYKNKYKRIKDMEFLGILDRQSILENLKQSNVFLFPSKIDSFWLVIIESMSQAVPVVCFDKPGQDEIITNWEDGFLVETDNEFIEKTKILLSNDELRTCLSQTSLKTSKRFYKEVFLERLSEIFTSF